MDERAEFLNVKIFRADLEENLNKWLKDNPDFKIFDIKYQTSQTTNGLSYSALVVYKDPSLLPQARVYHS